MTHQDHGLYVQSPPADDPVFFERKWSERERNKKLNRKFIMHDIKKFHLVWSTKAPVDRLLQFKALPLKWIKIWFLLAGRKEINYEFYCIKTFCDYLTLTLKVTLYFFFCLLLQRLSLEVINKKKLFFSFLFIIRSQYAAEQKNLLLNSSSLSAAMK